MLNACASVQQVTLTSGLAAATVTPLKIDPCGSVFGFCGGALKKPGNEHLKGPSDV